MVANYFARIYSSLANYLNTTNIDLKKCSPRIAAFLFVLFQSALCQADSSLIGSDTITVNGNIYKIELWSCHDGIRNLYIITGNDTIINRKNYSPADIKYDDLNSDGFTDILFIHYPTTVPGISDLYLFDERESSFVEVEGFSKFPDPKRIGKTTYFYSYHRSGCADYYWDSDLFYIKDFRAIKIANIHAVGCDDEPQKGVYIFDLTNQTPIQVDFIKMKKIKTNKWHFIQNYWSNNYEKFLNPKDIK